ncbi:hypothetical protein LCGC14_2317430 [marine sediment metagenome]|uniref:CMP/dCMP-type deaminase domain-containing protein n=1 Tax=marine sediment metagenome TaxID=412755 RepID=A0A0F9CJH3_9ZZZZ
MHSERPTREQIHMNTAFLWSQRATCKLPDRKIGCIITTEDMNRILSIGYNGSPTVMPNDTCRNITGGCGCLHAEQNAVAMVDGTIPHKVMFITMEPCESCANLIAQSNIDKLYYCDEYRNHEGLMRLDSCHIEITRIKR